VANLPRSKVHSSGCGHSSVRCDRGSVRAPDGPDRKLGVGRTSCVCGPGELSAIWILLPHKLTLSSKANTWVDWARNWNGFVTGNLGRADACHEDRPAVAVAGLTTNGCSRACRVGMGRRSSESKARIGHAVALDSESFPVQVVYWPPDLPKCANRDIPTGIRNL
jgi:hypothetical protein